MMNKGVVYALWGYEAQNSDELSFHEGDAITVLRRKDENETEWWWARLGDQEGYVPKTLLGVSALSLRSGIGLSCYSSTPEHVCKSAVGTLGRVWGHVLLGDRRRGLPFPTPQLSATGMFAEPPYEEAHASSPGRSVRFPRGELQRAPRLTRQNSVEPRDFLTGVGAQACRLPPMSCDHISPVAEQPRGRAGDASLNIHVHLSWPGTCPGVQPVTCCR